MTHIARYEEFKITYVPVAFTSEDIQLGDNVHYNTWTECMTQFDIWEQAGHILEDRYVKTYQGSRCVQSTHIE